MSDTALTVDEGGSGTYTARLNTEPTATVTVDMSAQVGNQTTLTFISRLPVAVFRHDLAAA